MVILNGATPGGNRLRQTALFAPFWMTQSPSESFTKPWSILYAVGGLTCLHHSMRFRGAQWCIIAQINRCSYREFEAYHHSSSLDFRQFIWVWNKQHIVQLHVQGRAPSSQLRSQHDHPIAHFVVAGYTCTDAGDASETFVSRYVRLLCTFTQASACKECPKTWLRRIDTFDNIYVCWVDWGENELEVEWLRGRGREVRIALDAEDLGWGTVSLIDDCSAECSRDCDGECFRKGKPALNRSYWGANVKHDFVRSTNGLWRVWRAKDWSLRCSLA